MTEIAITAHGTVTGSNASLVAAAADLLDAIPQQPGARRERIAELLAAVRTPLDLLV